MERYFILKLIDVLPNVAEETIEDILKGSFNILLTQCGFESVGLYAFDQKALDADMVKTPRRNRGNGLVKEVIAMPQNQNTDAMVGVASKSMYVSKPFNYTHQDTSLVSRLFPVLATSDTASISFCDTIPTGQFARLGVLVLTFRVGNIIDDILSDIWEEKYPFKKMITLYLIRRVSSYPTTPENNLSASCSNERIPYSKESISSDHLSTFLTEMSGVLCNSTSNFAIPKILVSFSSLIKRTKREVDWKKCSYVDTAILRSRIMCNIPSSKTQYYIFALWEELCITLDAIASLYQHPEVRVEWAHRHSRRTTGSSKSRRPICSSSVIPRIDSIVKNDTCVSLHRSQIPRIDISMTKGYNKRSATNNAYVSVYGSLIPKIDLTQTKGYKKRKSRVTRTPRTFVTRQKRKIKYCDLVTITFSGDMVIHHNTEPFILGECLRYIESSLTRINGCIKFSDGEVVVRIPSSSNAARLWWWETILLKSSYRKKAGDVVVTIYIDDPTKEELACDVFNVASAWGCRVRLLQSSNTTQVFSKKHITVSIGNNDRDVQIKSIDDIELLFIRTFA